MENSKKASNVIAVLTQDIIEKLATQGSIIWQGVNDVDKAHDEILQVLFTNENSLEHFNAVQQHVLDGMKLGKGFSMGYAQNLWGDFMKFAKSEGYVKPRTEKAQAEQNRRDEVKKVMAEKYGKISDADLKQNLISAQDSKTMNEITKVLTARKKEKEKIAKENNSDFIKSTKDLLNKLLNSKNENAVKNATKILAFIKKENLQ
jgi:hypothetical protein